MTIEEFKKSCNGEKPPVCLSLELKSMWYAANNDWNKAHNLIQNEKGSRCFIIHAYLHRIEGDINNADYWYSKAGTVRPQISIEDEFEKIIKDII